MLSGKIKGVVISGDSKEQYMSSLREIWVPHGKVGCDRNDLTYLLCFKVLF